MARIPDYTDLGRRQSAATGVGAPRVSLDAVAAPGRAIAGLGATMGQISRAMEAEQDRQDRILADDQFNKLRKEMQDLTIGEGGYTHKQGESAVKEPIMRQWTEMFSAKADALAGELKNENQRRYYKAQRDVAELQYREGILNHVVRQSKIYEKQVYDGGITVETDLAKASWADPNSVKVSIARVESLVEKQAESESWAKDYKDAELFGRVSDIHVGVIGQAASAGDVSYAREWYKKHYNEIDPDRRAKIEEGLASEERTVKSRSEADRYMATYDSESDALAAIRKEHKGTPEEVALADQIVDRVKRRFHEVSVAEAEGKKDAIKQGWDHTIAGGDPNDLPLELRQLIGPEIAQMAAYAAVGGTKATNIDKHDEFYRLLDQGDITTAEQVEDYYPYFSKSDRAAARKAFESAGKISDADLRRAFELRKEAPVKNNQAEYLAFQSYAINRIESTRRKQDLDMVADEWFMSGNLPGDPWFGPETLGEAITKGKDEFILGVPESMKPMVSSANAYILGTLSDTPYFEHFRGADQNDIYTRYLRPAEYYLRAHGIPVTDRTLAAHSILKMVGKMISEETVRYVADSMTEKFVDQRQPMGVRGSR